MSFSAYHNHSSNKAICPPDSDQQLPPSVLVRQTLGLYSTLPDSENFPTPRSGIPTSQSGRTTAPPSVPSYTLTTPRTPPITQPSMMLAVALAQ